MNVHRPAPRARPVRPLRSAPGLLLAALLAVLPACATGGAASGQAPEPGTCYFFAQDAEAASLRLPQGIQLLDRALEGWPTIMRRGDVRVAVTLTRDGEADYPFGYWLLEDEGIEVGYPAGGGIVLDLAADGRALEGTARAVGDAVSLGDEGGEPPTIDVRLEPGACPG